MPAARLSVAALLTAGLLTPAVLLGSQEWVTGDVSYFDDSLSALGVTGLAGTLVEYPPPAVAVLGLPWVLAQWVGVAGAYGVLLMVAAGLTDLAFTLLLARARRGLLPPPDEACDYAEVLLGLLLARREDPPAPTRE